jgi:hypothetical protein
VLLLFWVRLPQTRLCLLVACGKKVASVGLAGVHLPYQQGTSGAEASWMQQHLQ